MEMALIALVSLGLGCGLAWFVLRAETRNIRAANEALQSELRAEGERKATAEEKSLRIPELEEAVARKEKAAEAMQAEQVELKTYISELETKIAEERKRAAEKLEILEKAREQLKLEFQNIANRIFEDKTSKFAEQNKAGLDTLLSPVREQLKDFRKKVEDVYDKESKDRMSLFHEIRNLQNLNQQISEDAVNLTKALKGQSKTQGAWGEMALERLLEESGLHRGREYETQGSFADQDGRQKRPDVIVHLPDNKDVIIDAKVSLTAYEQYCSAADEQERSQALKLHIGSIRTHIKQLSEKSYEDLDGIRTLDFVLMFMPIEGAFLAALDADPKLFNDAFERNIILVCPSTMLATLRTINNIWRYEAQNRNAMEIARQAGALYDKFVGFIDSLDDIGQKIGKARDAYEKARNQLHAGRGNLVRSTEKLKLLGAKAKKALPEAMLDEIEEE